MIAVAPPTRVKVFVSYCSGREVDVVAVTVADGGAVLVIGVVVAVVLVVFVGEVALVVEVAEVVEVVELAGEVEVVEAAEVVGVVDMALLVEVVAVELVIDTPPPDSVVVVVVESVLSLPAVVTDGVVDPVDMLDRPTEVSSASTDSEIRPTSPPLGAAGAGATSSSSRTPTPLHATPIAVALPMSHKNARVAAFTSPV